MNENLKEQIEIYKKELMETYKKSSLNNMKEEGISDSKSNHGNQIVNENGSNEEVVQYKNAWEFESQNKGRGTLAAQVFTGQQTYPIKGAKVTVYKVFSNGKKLYGEFYTDENGQTPELTLPTPSKVLSQIPSKKQPFAYYNVLVEAAGYVTEKYINVPVFPATNSIQPVFMIPLAVSPDTNIEIVNEKSPIK